MLRVIYPLNWHIGWTLILAGFLSGAIIGLGFARENFLGGYTSFPRRLVRLGHIALVALGALNVLASVAIPTGEWDSLAAAALIWGAFLMPAICFLTAWKSAFRHLFVLPVAFLICAVLMILKGGVP